MTEQSKKILERCKFDPCEYKGVKLGELILGPHENKRLLPIITELLSIIEVQGEALDDRIKDHMFECECWHHLALAETSARLNKLAGGE